MNERMMNEKIMVRGGNRKGEKERLEIWVSGIG